MRITHFRIENYRGIRLAEMIGLESSPLTLFTGRNGTGKSLVLEALTAGWSGNINLPELVGPYGHAVSIKIGLALEEHEYESIDVWREKHGSEPAVRLPEHVIEAASTRESHSGFYRAHDEVLETLQDPSFANDHPFASIDLLSARRQSSLSTSTSVDLALLDRAAALQERRSMYDQEIRWKSAMQMPDVGSYLTSLDYRDYIAHREGLPPSGEYSRITETFYAATGKKISLPKYDPVSTKSGILVTLPTGQTHPLSDLSNGEREMLGMLYYVSQLSILGGVLLLDEPEKHLHPTLQLAMLKSMMTIAGRGQILVVTHAPGLISSSPSEAVVIVHPAWSGFDNQLQLASRADPNADILAELGLSRRDLFQANFLLVVEGPDDEKRLRMLFPDELAGARVLVAGGRVSALRSAETLRKFDLGMPWLCVIDRDFLTDSERSEISKFGDVFVWNARMLENVLLSNDAIIGLILPKEADFQVAKATVRSIIDELRTPAIEQFVQARAEQWQPDSSKSRDRRDGIDKIHFQMQEQKRLWEERIDFYPRIRESVETEILEGWGNSWHRYVDGKRVFNEIQRQFPVFRNASMMIDSLMFRVRESEVWMPDEARGLKTRLRDLGNLDREHVAEAVGEAVDSRLEEFAVRDREIERAAAETSRSDHSLNLSPNEMYRHGGK